MRSGGRGMKITKISFLLMGYPAAALVAYEYESGIESEDVQGYRITNPPIERATGGEKI